MSAADPANPVVMWQLATAGHHFIPKQYLVAHKLKFMRQNLDAQTGKTARDFAEAIAAYQPNRVWGSPFFFKPEASASAVAAKPAETASSVASAKPAETSSSVASAKPAETSAAAATAVNSCVATALSTNAVTTDPKLQKLLELN